MEKHASFVFKREWLEAAGELQDPAEQAMLLMAIATYGIEGIFTPTGSAAVNAVMRIVMADIDAKAARSGAKESPDLHEKVKAELELTKGFIKNESEFYNTDGYDLDLLKQGVRGYLERFGYECVARRRFHSSESDYIDDFRHWFIPGICDSPKESARYLRSRRLNT